MFSWWFGLPKSCRQVNFLCLPIWMGSYPWRYSHSSKILFDDLSENIIYYRGISPGRPALLPTGTSVSSPSLLTDDDTVVKNVDFSDLTAQSLIPNFFIDF